MAGGRYVFSTIPFIFKLIIFTVIYVKILNRTTLLTFIWNSIWKNIKIACTVLKSIISWTFIAFYIILLFDDSLLVFARISLFRYLFPFETEKTWVKYLEWSCRKFTWWRSLRFSIRHLRILTIITKFIICDLTWVNRCSFSLNSYN